MTRVHYYNRSFTCKEGQTVLDVLLENGEDIPYSCKMGVCVTCVMKVIKGDVPLEAQAGLRESLVAKGHFLPCVCPPSADMTVAKINQQEVFSPAVVADIEYLPSNVCRVYLHPTTPLYYRAGQFVNLRREDGLSRSYSLASVPSLDDHLEFHVKRFDQGQMSRWILDDLRVGDHLGLQGPIGDCYYQPGRADQNMLLIGTGTGLAPLMGIARDALASGHTGAIWLYHGSREQDGLYLGDALRALQATYDNFHYVPCVSGDGAHEGYRQGRADDIAFDAHANLNDWRVFLCGYPKMVYSATTWAVSANAKADDIFADPYELKDLRKEPRSPDTSEKTGA